MFLEISFNITFKRFNFKRLCLFLRPSWISDLGQKENFVACVIMLVQLWLVQLTNQLRYWKISKGIEII